MLNSLPTSLHILTAFKDSHDALDTLAGDARHDLIGTPRAVSTKLFDLRQIAVLAGTMLARLLYALQQTHLTLQLSDRRLRLEQLCCLLCVAVPQRI